MFPPSQQIRWLIDCDSFYASCEVYLNPKLRWLPVCIWWDIVIARSYEAKPYGIKVGTPIREAKKMLPNNAVYLRPNITKYGQISSSLMKYLQDKCLQVEVFSIDEAFIEITDYAEIYHMSYQKIARAMRHDIRRKIGIPVSIGLAPTRLLSKIFADINKPFGECIAITPSEIDAALRSLPLSDIPFVWPKTQEKLVDRCTTAYDYKALPYEYVRELLGKNGLKIRMELNSINAMNFANKHTPKSINRTRSFNPHFTNKKSEVRSRLLENIDKACEHLLDQKLATKHLAISFRTKEFHRHWLDLKLPYATNDKMLITQSARKLFERIAFADDILYRTTGIYLWDLVDATNTQYSLFQSTKQTTSKKQLNDIIYRINKKYWRWAIRLWEAKAAVKKNDLFEMML